MRRSRAAPAKNDLFSKPGFQVLLKGTVAAVKSLELFCLAYLIPM